MTAIARRVRATPVRTTADTWAFVVDLISSGSDTMCSYLERAGNAAAMLVGEEHTRLHPMVLSGCGPQVRIYTLHDTAAIDGSNANQQRLLLAPTDGWEIALPATGTDLDLAAAAIGEVSHVTVYDHAR